jgi:hypothetical protein
MLLYENVGRLEDNVDEVLTVIPVLYEWDGGQQLGGFAQTLSDVAAIAVPLITVAFGGPIWLGTLASQAPEAVKKLVKSVGGPADREIGLVNDGNSYRFDPIALSMKLNPNDLAIANAVSSPRGYGRGIYNFYFKDPVELGDSAYSAYVEVRLETWPDMM